MVELQILNSSGFNTFTPPVSDDIHNVAVLAGIAVDVTVPAGAKHVVFSTTVNFYIGWNTTGAAVADTDVELNPSQKALGQKNLRVDTFSIVSADAGNVCYQFYG